MHMTPDERETRDNLILSAWHDDEMTMHEIGLEFGMATATVGSLLRRHGISPGKETAKRTRAKLAAVEKERRELKLDSLLDAVGCTCGWMHDGPITLRDATALMRDHARSSAHVAAKQVRAAVTA